MHLTTALRLNETHAKPVVALIGAGGKSTLLFRLGEELAAAGRQTLLTATTRLWTQQIDYAPFSVIDGDPFDPISDAEQEFGCMALGKTVLHTKTCGPRSDIGSSWQQRTVDAPITFDAFLPVSISLDEPSTRHPDITPSLFRAHEPGDRLGKPGGIVRLEQKPGDTVVDQLPMTANI